MTIEVVKLKAENIDAFQPYEQPDKKCQVTGCRKGAKIKVLYSSGTPGENQQRGYTCPRHACDFANSVLDRYKFRSTGARRDAS